jgi:outer membrane lipoprotein-sorting protein
VNIGALTADEIILKMEETEKIDYSLTVMEQKVITPSGEERTFVVKGYSIDNGEKSLSIYEEPARVKGEKILSLNDGDDIWTYSPKTRRVRHLATHMKKAKVMGSDFSYEDIAGGNYKEKFTFKLLPDENIDGVDCFKLELIPTPKGPDYKKLLTWVDKNTWFGKKTEYYDANGLLKTLSITETKMVEGRLVPWTIIMINNQSGGKTEMFTRSMTFSEKTPEWMFTEEGLKRN